MKNFCLEKRFEGWSLFSIAKQALFENIVCACVGTWRKYMKIFGIEFSKALNRRKKHKTGIRSNKPNALWHGDVTLLRTLDNQLHYIYIVMDNFSRRILNYMVSTVLSGQICLENIRLACDKFLSGGQNKDDTWILLDGGPENDNVHVEDYVQDDSIPLKRFFAMRDLRISNSMIERFNMTLKYSYLFRKDIQDGQDLITYLSKAIPDYNAKPHYAHNGNSPDNVFFGIPIDDETMSKRMKQAQLIRLEKNRKHNCGLC